MPNFSETPEQTADRCLRELVASLRRAGRAPGKTFYYAREIDGRAVSIASRVPKPTTDGGTDLPPQLRKARESMRVAYRAVMAMRAEGEARELWPSDVTAWLDDHFPTNKPHSIDTLNHALRDLRTLRLAWAPDEKGWRIGSEQNALPIGNRQSEQSSTSTEMSYPGRAAADGGRQFRSATMSKELIWVPGEETDYGVVVVDAVTEEAVLASEKTGAMQVPTRSGRPARSAAVRGELLRVEGKYAVVKIPGTGKKINTRVLGDWHLAGKTEPEPEEAEVV